MGHPETKVRDWNMGGFYTGDETRLGKEKLGVSRGHKGTSTRDKEGKTT